MRKAYWIGLGLGLGSALASARDFVPTHRPEPVEEPPSVRPLRDGVFRGIGRGFAGEIEVEVRIAGGRIAAVEVTREQETEPANALRRLPARIVKEQGTENVKAVSGATATSRGIFAAVESALRLSRGEPEGNSPPAAGREPGTFEDSSIAPSR